MKCSSAVAVFSFSAAVFAAVGCASNPDRSEGRYCTEVGNGLSALNKPAITTASDIAATLKVWRTVAGSAPIAIAAEWDTMVGAMATAATVNPNDPASMQRVADTARASEPAANRVIDYTYRKCNALIGNVAPLVTNPVTPTTVTPTT